MRIALGLALTDIRGRGIADVAIFSIGEFASQYEGNSGNTTFTAPVTRRGYAGGTASIDWAVSGTGTYPASPDDFVGGVYPSGTLTFAAGEKTKNISIEVVGDAASEDNETFLVTLSNPVSEAIIKIDAAEATIVDDDTSFPLAGATITFDFVNDRYYGATLSSATYVTRASVKTDLVPSSPSGYAYQTFAAGQMAISPGRGLLVEESRTNYFLNSASPATQAITLPSTGNYVLWVNGPGTATIAADTAVITGAGTASQGTVVVINCTTTGAVTVTIAGSLHAVQLEKGSAGTSFIPTAGAAVTRAVDEIGVGGAAHAVAAGAAGAIVQSVEATPATGNLACAYHNMAAVLNRNTSDTTGFGADNFGGNVAYFSLGSGKFTTGAKLGLSWSASNRKMVGNGGSVTTGTRLQARSNTHTQLGANYTSQAWNGFIKRIDFFPSQPTDATLRGFTDITPVSAAAWGDSLTARSDGPGSGISYPAALGTLLGGKTVMNGGVEGNTSTQIRTRFIDTGLYDKPTIIWAGRNNIAQGATIQSDIAAMVAAMTVPEYLVLGIINNDTEPSGNANYNTIIGINNDLSTTYTTRYLDIRALLVASYDPADPLDVLNNSQDIVPSTKRLILNNGVLSTAIADATTQAFTLSFNPPANSIIKIGDEYIRVTAASGANVTACERGYAGSTATAHIVNEPAIRRDTVHLSEGGRQFVAQKVYEKMQALGWSL